KKRATPTERRASPSRRAVAAVKRVGGSRTSGPRATSAPPPRSPRAPDLAAVRRALADGTTLELAAVHAAFEAARDRASDDPAALFDLAVDEARALDALASQRGAVGSRTAARAAVLPALLRVLEGGTAGTRPEPFAWAAARVETLLRSPAGR